MLHYTEGFSFDKNSLTHKITIAPKNQMPSLPKELNFDQNIAKRVIDGYFDHQMLSSLQSFFVKIQEENAMTQAFTACVLAEFFSSAFLS